MKSRRLLMERFFVSASRVGMSFPSGLFKQHLFTSRHYSLPSTCLAPNPQRLERERGKRDGACLADMSINRDIRHQPVSPG